MALASSDLVDRLNAGYGRGPGLLFSESPLGGIVAELEHGGARVIVALQGAQVLSYVPASGTDVLWVSPLARLGTGKAVRGGIPVCWPWFGPHPTDAGAPAHGFVRTVAWDVVGSAADEVSTRLRLACPYPEAHRAPWSELADLSLELSLGASLGLTLSTRNLSAQPLVLTEALHTYFAVHDIGSVVVTGLAGRNYIDQLEGGAVKTQPDSILFASEVDRIYGDPGADTTSVIDMGSKRRVLIRKTGSESTVVWNPWIAKSERLGDMGPDGYRKMVCVETANCGETVVTIAPGDTHHMSVAISAAGID